MAIKGSLREASLADVVQLLFLGRRSGRLSVASEHNFGTIWFDDGWVVFAGMVSRTDRLGERLVAAGRLTMLQLDEAIALQGAAPEQRLGATLVRLGHLTREELDAELRRQVEETVYTLFSWTSGTFSFDVGVTPDEGEARVRLNPEGLLLEGARRVDEWGVIAKKIPTLDTVFALDAAERPSGPDDGLVDVERRMIPLIDGRRPARELVDATGLTEFEVSRVLYALLSAGRIRRVSNAAPPPEPHDLSRLEEHRNLGVAFYRTAMFAEAEREFRRVIELKPSDGPAAFTLGSIALRMSRWEEAVEHLESAATHGRRPAVLHNLALAYEALGRLDESHALLDEATQLDRQDPRLWTGWGLLALRRSESGVALDRFARARDVMGESRPPARWFWGCAWAQALNEAWSDALVTAREGVAAYPDHPVLRTSLAVLLEGSGQVGEAEAHLRHALGEDPTIPQISKNLGDLLYRAARWEEAEEAYARAATLAPELGDDLFFKLGNLACRRGDLPSARRHWEEALAMNPEHALARANLAGAGDAR